MHRRSAKIFAFFLKREIDSIQFELKSAKGGVIDRTSQHDDDIENIR
jgi:hypothetical protein